MGLRVNGFVSTLFYLSSIFLVRFIFIFSFSFILCEICFLAFFCFVSANNFILGFFTIYNVLSFSLPLAYINGYFFFYYVILPLSKKIYPSNECI